jgi:hypothetical protein
MHQTEEHRIKTVYAETGPVQRGSLPPIGDAILSMRKNRQILSPYVTFYTARQFAVNAGPLYAWHRNLMALRFTQ